jgi:peptidoglycan/LPS O-acetylase OafA/YrhL
VVPRHLGEPLGFGNLLAHASLIAPFDDRLLHPVVWSLTHEMRISLVFPLLVWAAIRLRWRLSWMAAAIFTFFGYVLYWLDLAENFAMTVTCIPMFIAGILLAKHRHEIVGRYRRLPEFAQLALLALAIVTYTYAWLPPPSAITHLGPIDDWVTLVGVALFIVTALGSRRVASSLCVRPMLWLGRISYSLYLWHSVILVRTLRIAFDPAPLWLLLIGVIACSLLVAHLSERYVESPAQRLGRHLAVRAARTNSAASRTRKEPRSAHEG